VKSATAIGEWLRKLGQLPNQVVCSDAARTWETLALLSLEDTPTTYLRELYLAEPDTMARILRKQSGDCVLMVAHNPGSAFLAQQLLDHVPDHPEFDNYPTCATLIATFDIADWSELRMGTGVPENFIVPRDLIE
jgi:phosphohistidine phosphatase